VSCRTRAPGRLPPRHGACVERPGLFWRHVEILFGVSNHFGQSTEQVITEVAELLRYRMLRQEER
jgi:hypothetical protein